MDEKKVILFAGTTEGRRLGRELAELDVQVTLCVATQYGEDVVRPALNLEVRSGRMDAEDMAALLCETGCRLVVDATHPYAGLVSGNLRAACDGRAEYIRLLRGKGAYDSVVEVADAAAAAKVLAAEPGTALLTIGSKELMHFTEVPDYRQRLYVRVLPMPESLVACMDLGFPGNRIICMQGPFSHGLNVEMLRQTGATWLVTKDSGDAGGFGEKLSAVHEAGARVLLIRRPVAGENGLDYESVRSLLFKRFGLQEKVEEKQPLPRFPLFVKLEGKPVVIVGGGKVALRRAKSLHSCGADITIIAPQIHDQLAELRQQGLVRWKKACYCVGDLKETGAILAVAATDNRQMNRLVGQEAQALRIPCSVADAPEEGSFWFPALVQGGGISAGLVSVDGDHHAVRNVAALIRGHL